MKLLRSLTGLALLLCTMIMSGEARAETACQDDSAESGYKNPAGVKWCDRIADYWGEVTEHATVTEKQTCDGGNRQSPINLKLPPNTDTGLGYIRFAYTRSSGDLTLNNNGHSVELPLDPKYYTAADGKARIRPPGVTPDAPPERSMTVNGKKYKLDSFHFHHPSEHLLDGQRFAMELHFVFVATGTDTGRAVIGVFLDAGGIENPALGAVFENFASTKNKGDKKRMALTSAALHRALPADRSYLQYDGSLTTPGCNEDVTWRVFKTPVPVSQAQIDKFTAAIKTPLNFTGETVPVNARKWRDAGSRVVKLSPSYAPDDLTGSGALYCGVLGGVLRCSGLGPSGLTTFGLRQNPTLATAGSAGTAFLANVGEDRPSYCWITGTDLNCIRWRDVYTPPSKQAGLKFGSAPRFLADVNGDGMADLCRFLGEGDATYLSCSLRGTNRQFGPAEFPATAPQQAARFGPGLAERGRFMVDVNGDGRADYCRFVGTSPETTALSCMLATDSGFGPQELKSGAGASRLTPRSGQYPAELMGDVNGDGRADYCRIVGGDVSSMYLTCALASVSGFGNEDFNSAQGISYGPDTGLGADIFLADINDDGRADFCRFVGSRSTKQTFVCTLATSSGFGSREVRAEILRPEDGTPSLMVDRR